MSDGTGVRLGVVALAFLVAGGAAMAHNGEYHPPLPPPKIEGGPRPAKGTTSPAPRDDGTVTPGPDDVKPNDPLSSPPTLPGPPRPGLGRDDARLTVRIWWEANRHRFLPAPPELPMRDELVSVLLDAVDQKSEAVRDRALTALGRAGGTQAFHRIRDACLSKDPGRRVAATMAMGLLGDDTGSAILKKLVADAEAGVETRTFAALSLGLQGSGKDASFLREVLNEEWEPNVRSAAAIALGFLKDPESANALGRILLDAHPLPSPETKRIGDAGPRAGLAAASAFALGRILSPRAYDYLVWGVGASDPDVATSAALALVRAEGTVGLPTLYRALRPGGTLAVRQLVLLGLAERQDEVAIETAKAILASELERQGHMGPFAALALGLTGDERHSGLLLSVVRDRALGPELRAAAALALGLSGQRAAGAGLSKVISNEQRPAVAGWGVIALARLGHASGVSIARKILEESDLPEPRRDAVTALYLLAPDGVADLLVKELADSYHVNREAALALARVDARRAAIELTKKLADPNLFARRYAAHSLGVLLARRRPGPLTDLSGQMNLLSGAPILRACLFLENEYLFQLVRNF